MVVDIPAVVNVVNMATTPLRHVLMLIGASASFAQDPVRGTIPLPRFEDYPANATVVRTPAVPRFRTGDDIWPDADPKFRQAATTAALDGPSFAGKLTIAKIPCGTGCLYVAVINVENGEMSTNMPFYSLLVGPFDDKTGSRRIGGISYGLHSRLLIASGCFDATRDDEGYCARVYYEWKDDHFQLIKRVPLDWH